MFKVGNTVFCPMRGSGVVEAIETREMLGESKEYVIIQMKEPSLTMMISTDKINQSGFRAVHSVEDVKQVEIILTKKETELSHEIDVKKRTKINQDKLSEGGFIKCSEVVRDLACMETIKSLNNMERTLLMQAKRLLADELSIIKNISVQEANERINDLLMK